MHFLLCGVRQRIRQSGRGLDTLSGFGAAPGMVRSSPIIGHSAVQPEQPLAAFCLS